MELRSESGEHAGRERDVGLVGGVFKVDCVERRAAQGDRPLLVAPIAEVAVHGRMNRDERLRGPCRQFRVQSRIQLVLELAARNRPNLLGDCSRASCNKLIRVTSHFALSTPITQPPSVNHSNENELINVSWGRGVNLSMSPRFQMGINQDC